jgi:hypothetical protein
VSEQWGQPEQPGGDWSMPQDAPQDALFATPTQQDPQFNTPTQPFDAQPPQFGAPQPPPYGGFPPPAEFGAPAYGYPVYGQPAGNGLAVAGFVLAFLFWPVGILLSVVGLRRANGLGGKGKGLAIAGVTISILALLCTIGVAYVAFAAPAADPGCTTAETQLRTINSDINTDINNSNNPNVLITDFTALKNTLDSSLTVAKHANVRSAIALTDTDAGTLLTDFNAYVTGSGSVTISQINSDLAQVNADETALNSLCSSL